MSYTDTYIKNDWNVLCAECGRKKKASYLVKNWQGYYVCPEHNEPRHPQDFVRGITEKATPPWTRPEATTDTFIDPIAPGSGFFIPGVGFIQTPPVVPPFTAITTPETIVSGGSGYTTGDIVAVDGATFTVTASGGVITSIAPVNPATTSATACSIAVVLSFDPAVSSTHLALTNNNLTATTDGTAIYQSAAGIFASSGKLYCEIIFDGNVGINSGRGVGIGDATATLADGTSVGNTTTGYAYDHYLGNKVNSGISATYGATWDGGVTLGILWNADVGTLSFSKNGVDQGIAYTGITGSYRIIVTGYGTYNGTTGAIFTANFGASTWQYQPPAGYIGWAQASALAVSGGTGTGGKLSCPVIATVRYATLDPNRAASWLVLSNWGLVAYTTNPQFGSVGSTVMQVTGVNKQLYCEFTVIKAPGGSTLGLAQATFPYGVSGDYVGSTSDSYGLSPTLKWNNNSSSSYGVDFGIGSVIGMLFNASTGVLAYTVNGVSQGTAFTVGAGTYCPAISLESSGGDATAISVNFGTSPWKHQPPAGYLGWTA